MSENEMLLLALSLSLLGYNLGILFLSFPLPFQGIKRWAPVLMRDSLYAAILVFSSNLILGIVPYFQSLLGASWGYFHAWITGRISWLIGWRTAIAALISASSKITGGFFFYTIMEPLVKMLNYALTTLYSILSLSIIVKSFYARFIIMGILLLSVPFRLTRSVGAYLIAFAIVFTIGLPFMPSFVSSFSSPSLQEPPSDADVAFGYMNVGSLLGRHICYPVVVGKQEDKVIFIYKGDSAGQVSAGYPDLGLPGNSTYDVFLNYMGIITPLEPSPVVPERDYRITVDGLHGRSVVLNLTSPLIIDEPLCYAIVLRSPMVSLSSILLGDHEGSFEAKGYSDNSYIEFRWASGLSLSYTTAPRENLTIVNGTWSWRGLEGRYTRIYLSSNQSVFIHYSFFGETEGGQPIVNQKSYLDSIGLSPWKDFTRFASSILMSWVVLPAIYLFILGAVSSAVAYLIGGARSRVPIKMW